MTHPSTERLQALVAGTLDRETETALLSHVEACESCLESCLSVCTVWPEGRVSDGSVQGSLVLGISAAAVGTAVELMT